MAGTGLFVGWIRGLDAVRTLWVIGSTSVWTAVQTLAAHQVSATG